MNTAAITCTRLLGREGEACRTCGRNIVRHDFPDAIAYRPGDYALQHEGPSIAQRLHELNEERRRTA